MFRILTSKNNNCTGLFANQT